MAPPASWVSSESSDTISSSGNVKLEGGSGSDTNIIIAQADTGNYVVWTKEAVGANVRQAILSLIQTQFNNSSVTLSNISFRSGENPGTLQYDEATDATATLTYDTNSPSAVTFTNGSTVTWTAYYAGVYTVESGTDGSMKTTATEVRVYNGYDPLIKVLKVDDSDNSTVLASAKFQLYYYDGTTKYYYTGKEDNTLQWSTDSTAAVKFTTDSNGFITIGRMDPGTYYLEEVSAPDGYTTLTNPICFTVEDFTTADEGGTVSLSYTDADGKTQTATAGTTSDKVAVDNTKATLTWNSPYYTITIADRQGIELPVTGGLGTLLLMLAGIVLLVLGALGLRKFRRRLPA